MSCFWLKVYAARWIPDGRRYSVAALSLYFSVGPHVPVLIPFVVTSRPTTASRPSNQLNPSPLAPQIRLCGPLCAFIIYLYAYLLTYLDDGWRKADAGECQHCRPGCSAPTDTVVRARSDTGELALQAWPKSLWKSSITSTSSVSSYVWDQHGRSLLFRFGGG